MYRSVSICIQEQERSYLNILENKYMRNTALTYISINSSAENISQKDMSEIAYLPYNDVDLISKVSNCTNFD